MPKQKDDIEFEIKFYESLLKKKPDFTEAISALADLYTKSGRYVDGLHLDRRLAQIRPQDPMVMYNLACSYSLLQEIDKAFVAIQQAIQYGYDDFMHLEKDTDLSNLRQDMRFQNFYRNVKQSQTENS
jgi:tetratricopeptide (TPR) repeat protein